jgi:hypothetical protein
VENNRPFGVLIERAANQNLAATTLFTVEVPEPYAGDTDDTAVVLSLVSVDPAGLATVRADLYRGQFSGGLVRLGDRIQFGGQGWMYTIVAANKVDVNGYVESSGVPPSPSDGFPLVLQVYITPNGSLPWPSFPALSQPTSFQIFRRPVKSAATPLELPVGVAIDLLWSGASTLFLPYDENDFSPVIITFTPSGALDRVFATDYPTGVLGNASNGTRIMDPIYLLVGNRDRIPWGGHRVAAPPPGYFAADEIPTDDTDNQGRKIGNERDLANLWIAINPQTGLITCTELYSPPNGLVPGDVLTSRKFARESHSMGGR